MSELGSLVELLGEDAALKLIELYGGTRLTVPKRIGPEDALGREVGEAAVLLARYFGGSEVKVPMARPWRALIYQRMGLTRRQMARRLGCTETAVYGYLARPRALPEPVAAEESAQGTLPV
ncbi:MAG: hypothetical protein M0002_03335 [Rhodospirillales bacterium]|nr:hypothetical protein [Rhodospirillales bacterium]